MLGRTQIRTPEQMAQALKSKALDAEALKAEALSANLGQYHAFGKEFRDEITKYFAEIGQPLETTSETKSPADQSSEDKLTQIINEINALRQLLERLPAKSDRQPIDHQDIFLKRLNRKKALGLLELFLNDELNLSFHQWRRVPSTVNGIKNRYFELKAEIPKKEKAEKKESQDFTLYMFEELAKIAAAKTADKSPAKTVRKSFYYALSNPSNPNKLLECFRAELDERYRDKDSSGAKLPKEVAEFLNKLNQAESQQTILESTFDLEFARACLAEKAKRAKSPAVERQDTLSAGVDVLIPASPPVEKEEKALPGLPTEKSKESDKSVDEHKTRGFSFPFFRKQDQSPTAPTRRLVEIKGTGIVEIKDIDEAKKNLIKILNDTHTAFLKKNRSIENGDHSRPYIARKISLSQFNEIIAGLGIVKENTDKNSKDGDGLVLDPQFEQKSVVEIINIANSILKKCTQASSFLRKLMDSPTDELYFALNNALKEFLLPRNKDVNPVFKLKVEEEETKEQGSVHKEEIITITKQKIQSLDLSYNAWKCLQQEHSKQEEASLEVTQQTAVTPSTP